MQGIGRKPDAAGDEKERDGKQAAEDGAPGGPLGVAADEKPLGVGGARASPSIMVRNREKKAAGVVPLKGLK